MEPITREYRNGEVCMVYREYPGHVERTFVLIHGIGMGGVVFAEVAALLQFSGSVIALDLPGFGDSPEPDGSISLEATAARVLEFVRNHATGEIVLVGHSMGTQIVTEMVKQQPDIAVLQVLIAPTVNRCERNVVSQAFRMLQDLGGEAPKVIWLGLREYVKTSPLWFYRKLLFMLGHKIELIAPQVLLPTLIIRGETDRLSPRLWCTELVNIFPDAAIQEIADRGHEAIIRSPEPVASMVLKFVRKNSPLCSSVGESGVIDNADLAGTRTR